MDRDAIVKDVVNVLNDMTTDWEAGFQGKIGPGTRLVADLGFESIDVVQLAVALEEHFGQEGLPFDKMLMTEGRYVDDLRVEQVVSFLAEHLRS